MNLAASATTRSRRPHWLFGALALVAVVCFALLGRWQWQRADQKRVAQDLYAAATAAPAVPLAAGGLAVLPRYAWVQIAGRFDTTQQFLLDNMQRDGLAGYEVLTPLALADGRRLLVNRGWLPLRDGNRAQLPAIDFAVGGDAPADAPLSLLARVDELPVSGLASGRMAPAADGPWPKLTSFPTTAELSAALGATLEPRQLLLDAGSPHGYRRDWTTAGARFGPERHVSYAIQWWSLGALVVVLYLVMNLRHR